MDLEKISPEVEKLAVGTSFCIWMASVIFGSNYRRMIAEAPCPVVTVHHVHDEVTDE
jgi:nucleotide-binding universal stress UspA family protein